MAGVAVAGRSPRTNPDAPWYPSRLLLQWHITDRCNLRCTHCYQSGQKPEESHLDELMTILSQFTDFLKLPCSEGRPPIRGHITITGGEPFVHPDFLELLSIFALHRKQFGFAILTNGSLISRSLARRLKKLKPAFVQVSIEGTESTHDRIRGRGNYCRTAEGVKNLVKAGLNTFVSFTAHRDNIHEFGDVVRLGRRLKVSRIWSDRLIPVGRGEALRSQLLTPDETRDFFRTMAKLRKKAGRAWFRRTEIAMHRALQFLESGGRPYHCTAGDTLITIMPDGTLYPCRRMPISAGNVLETPIRELYNTSTLFGKLRDPDNIPAGCAKCVHATRCRGGLKCLSHALTGDPFSRDPGCWVLGS